MKKGRILLTFFVLALTMGLTTSCEKTEKKIIGTWEATSAALLEGEGELELVGATFTFNDDKTISITADGETHSGTYSVDNDNLVIDITYTQEGYSLQVLFDLEVLEITKENMTVEGAMDMYIGGTLFDKSKIKVSMKKIK